MADETVVVDAPVTEPAPVETTPAAEPKSDYASKVESLTPEERMSWRLSGQLPDRLKSDAKADSSTATSETSSPEGTVETSPDSEPGTTEQPKPKSPRNSWSEVREQLAAERAKVELLEKQLAAQNRTSPPVAPKEEPKPALTEKPKRPKLEDPQFKTAADYDKAMDAYEDAKEQWDQQQYEARENAKRQTEVQTQAQQTWTAQIETEKKAHADFEAVAFNPKVPASNASIRILRSLPNGAALAYWLGKPENLAEATRIAQLTNIPGTEKYKLAELEQLAAQHPHIALAWGEAKGIAKAELLRISERLKKAVSSNQPARLPKPSAEVAVEANTAPQGDPLKAAIARDDVAEAKRLMNEADPKLRKFRR